ELAATIQARPDHRTGLETAVTDAQDADNTLPAAELRSQQHSHTLASVQRRDELAGVLADHERNVSEHAAHDQSAVDDVALIDKRMIRGMAGELAAQLQDGQPCAVCGSPTHPEPARQSENHPDHDAIEEAEAVQARAERQLADAREAYERVRAELAALNDQCGTISSTQAEADDEEAQTQLTYI